MSPESTLGLALPEVSTDGAVSLLDESVLLLLPQAVNKKTDKMITSAWAITLLLIGLTPSIVIAVSVVSSFF